MIGIMLPEGHVKLAWHWREIVDSRDCCFLSRSAADMDSARSKMAVEYVRIRSQYKLCTRPLSLATSFSFNATSSVVLATKVSKRFFSLAAKAT